MAEIIFPAPRRRLPVERRSITHRFEIGGHKGYLTVGLYEDGHPGELFIRMGGVGSFERGLLAAIGLLASMCLQSGVPLSDITKKFEHMSFEPDGWVGNGEHRQFQTSVLDYIARYLNRRFGGLVPEARP